MSGTVLPLILEVGVVALIATLFTAIQRRHLARPWFRYWQRAYVLLGLGLFGLVLQHSVGMYAPAGLMVYLVGRCAFAVLLLLGAIAYRRADEPLPVGPAIGAAALYGAVAGMEVDSATAGVPWHAPAAVVLVGLAAWMSWRPMQRRELGNDLASIALALYAITWAVFAVMLGIDQTALRPYIGYVPILDIFEICFLAVSMVLLVMEEARREARASELRLQTLVASTSDSLIIVNGDLVIQTVNPAAERLFGLPGSALLGRDVLTLLDLPDPAGFRAALVRALGATAPAIRIGEPDPVLVHRETGAPLRVDGSAWSLPDAPRAALLLRDVTAREEQRTRQVLQAKNDAVRQFAAGIAHDFNNILTTIGARSALLDREFHDDPRVREATSDITAAAETAARLARDLLALSGRQALRPAILDVNAAVRAIEPAIRDRLPAGVTADFRYALDAGRVRIDGVQFGEALLALAQNAADAMQATGGRILIATARGVRAAEARAGGVDDGAEYSYVSVHDTGAGLTVDARAHLFEPFFSTKGEGRGLGLPTALSFAQQSRGWLSVQSSTAGTIARIGFPITREEAITEPVTRPSVSGRWAMIAEDQPAVREVIELVLRQEGYRTISAGDGVAALEAWGTEGPELTVLIADVDMPRMGGPELAARVRQSLPRVPVILMSGYFAGDAVRAALPGEGVSFLQKPFNVDTLVRTLREARANRPRA